MAPTCSEAELEEEGCTGVSRLCSPPDAGAECFIIDSAGSGRNAHHLPCPCRADGVAPGVAWTRRRTTISPTANRSAAPAPSPKGEPAAEVAWNSRIAHRGRVPEHVEMVLRYSLSLHALLAPGLNH